MKDNTHGGERLKAGRKKLDAKLKSVTLTIYPKQYQVDKVGGIDAAKQLALNAIEYAPELSVVDWANKNK